MLDNETQKKYLRILQSGHTLKIDAKDAIELISGSEDLKDIEDQSSNKINTESAINNCTGKIIMKQFTIWHMDNKKILYWCPCSIGDIINLLEVKAYDEKTNKYTEVKRIPKEKQISFLGKDIKKSGSENGCNKLIKDFINRYIETDHPIADHVFYNVVFKEDGFKCFRNTELSPRPDKNEDTK